MELMIIIVQEQDYPKLSSTFIHNRVMATKFSTEGLYLNKKNITLMVCIEKEREEEILDYIRQSCTERMEEFRKAQKEIEKKNEKPMSQKIFKVI